MAQPKPANRPKRPAKAKPPVRGSRLTQAKPSAATAHARRGWALVVIDQEPIRRTAAEAYRQAHERLAALRGTVERFSTQDRPAFGGWMAARFGALLTELRELTAQIAEKSVMLKAIQIMTFVSGCSPREAYEEVIRGQAEDEQAAARREAGEPATEAEAEDEEFFAAMPEELKRMFGFTDSTKADGPGGPPSPDEAASDASQPRRAGRRAAKEPTAAEPSKSQRLKTAYRAVVRRLHPDAHPELTGYDQQLWHDAQRAYEKGDLEGLETILAVSEIAGGGELPSGSGLGGLLALTRQLEASVRKLERQVRGFRKDPAWDFMALASRDVLEQKVSVRLRQDVADIRAELAMIETELAFCRDAPPMRPRRSQQRRPSSRKAKR